MKTISISALLRAIAIVALASCTQSSQQTSGLQTRSESTQSIASYFSRAHSKVEIYRSSFATTDPLFQELTSALDQLKHLEPPVTTEIIIDSTITDPVLVFKIDGESPRAGPIDGVKGLDRWLALQISDADFQQFFNDARKSAFQTNNSLAKFNATPQLQDGKTKINDWSRLNATPVKRVVASDSESELVDLLKEARSQHLKVSIAGQRHSQGGHTFYKDALVLDMTRFHKIIETNWDKKTIRVQSGITWDAIQRHIQPHGLSVKVMQAYPLFTVGGSLSVNVHESDLRYGPIIETVNSLRLLTADGNILTVSRTENSELFGLAIGGYGLFGVILDVELSLTDDTLLQRTVQYVDYRQFASQFAKLLADGKTVAAYGRPSTAPDGTAPLLYAGDGFFRGASLVSYNEVPKQGVAASTFAIQEEGFLGLRKLMYDLSRKYDWAKGVRWLIQAKFGDTITGDTDISRNNMMRADIRITDYVSVSDTDALQEYFIPVDRLTDFMDALRAILVEYKVSVLSCGLRYVPENNEAFLSYSRTNVFGVVFAFNQRSSEEGVAQAKEWTRKIVDAAIENGGTYYLPYAGYPTRAQSRMAYPKMDGFFQKKSQYDPDLILMNQFYENYHLSTGN